jgi:hypothetical protein
MVSMIVVVAGLTTALRARPGGHTVLAPPAPRGGVVQPLPSDEPPLGETASAAPLVSASPVSSAGVPTLAPPRAARPSPSPQPKQPTAETPSPAGNQLNTSYGPYLLFNDRTGKCADVPGFDGGTIDGPVNQFTCNRGPADNQMWNFTMNGRRSDGRRLYSISNVKDGLCLDVPGEGPVGAGTSVTEFYCRGAEDNQYFYISRRRDGTIWLVNDKSDLCLDVAGNISSDNDAPLTLFYCSDNDDHNWRLR